MEYFTLHFFTKFLKRTNIYTQRHIHFFFFVKWGRPTSHHRHGTMVTITVLGDTAEEGFINVHN